MYWCLIIYWLFNYWLRLRDYTSHHCCHNECCTISRSNYCHFTRSDYCNCSFTFYAFEISYCLGSCSVPGGELHFAKCDGENDANSPIDDHHCFTCWWLFIWSCWGYSWNSRLCDHEGINCTFL